MTDCISVEKLGFCYPDRTRALDTINFSLKHKEKLAILGANGAGKTTLLHLLAGLEIPSEGLIFVNGKQLHRQTRKDMFRDVGLVFQNPDHQLFCQSLLDDVRFGPMNMGMTETEIDDAVESALNQVGLWQKRHKEPWRLSYGERKRGALAAVLSMKPHILLLDEPSAFLDPEATEAVESVLRQLDSAMILATQDFNLAHSVCTRGIYLQQGRILADEPIRDLLARKDMFQAARRAWNRNMKFGLQTGWKEHDEQE